jgi:hypothetical protein
VLAGTTLGAFAKEIPLPRPRPAGIEQAPQHKASLPSETEKASTAEADAFTVEEPPGPSACQVRLSELAVIKSVPSVAGPGECGGTDFVQLQAILLPDKSKVTISPPATLRCSMAEAVANWVREDVAQAALELGAPLKSIDSSDSYQCRGRNNIAGAKVSEHGKGNAIDLRTIRLANGTVADLTSAAASKTFREAVRQSACMRFKTVLGPGSDPYHEQHIHLDLAERSRGYAMCQWAVREVGEETSPKVVSNVPLPVPRPVFSKRGIKSVYD